MLPKQDYLVIILRAAPIPLPFLPYSAPIIIMKYCRVIGYVNIRIDV